MLSFLFGFVFVSSKDFLELPKRGEEAKRTHRKLKYIIRNFGSKYKTTFTKKDATWLGGTVKKYIKKCGRLMVFAKSIT